MEAIEEQMSTAEETATTQEVSNTDPLEQKEVQIAAGQYAQIMKRVRSLAKNMKAGQLARVMIASAGFPFAESYPTFRNEAEKELFVLLSTVEKAKGIIANALGESESMLKQTAVDNVADSIITKGGM